VIDSSFAETTNRNLKSDGLRDGFRVIKTTFTLPQSPDGLSPQLKRKATICNLFANYGLSIADLVRLLDDSYENAVHALIEERLIEDRRQMPRIADPKNRSASRSGKGRAFKAWRRELAIQAVWIAAMGCGGSFNFFQQRLESAVLHPKFTQRPSLPAGIPYAGTFDLITSSR
jgi:hypothetical protein